MMKKKIILSTLLVALVVSGCKKENENSISNPQNTISPIESINSSSSTSTNIIMPPEAVDFILMVNSIVINEESGIYIEEAWDLYDALGDNWDYPEVLKAYYKLLLLEEMYNDYIEVYNEALDFIEKVELIPYLLNLNDERYIISAESAYEKLSDEAKEIIGVSHAYGRLLKARNDYDELYAQSLEEERQETIDNFLKLISNLPSLDEFTVDDYEELNNALVSYELLSDDIKEENEIIEAYNKLLELEEKYKDLLNVTITLDPNDGVCDTESIEVISNEAIGTLPTPTRDGYKFLGWFTKDGEEVASKSTFKVDTKIYAQWQEIVNVVITLNTDGGICDVEFIESTNEESIGTLPTPTKEGYRFLGWFTEDGEEVTSTSIFETSTTIYAHWKEIIDVIITLDANGGECTTTYIETTNDKSIGTLPIPTKEGYRFLGWYTDSEEGEEVTSTSTFETNTTIYAHWEDENIIHNKELSNAYLNAYMDDHVRVLWDKSVFGNVTSDMSFTVVIIYNGQEYEGRVIDRLRDWEPGGAYTGIGIFRNTCPVNFRTDSYTITVTTTDNNGTIYSCTLTH